MEIEVYSNIRQVHRKLSNFPQVLQHAASATLKVMAQQTTREAAREVVRANYASKKLKPSDILGGRAKAVEHVGNFDPKPSGGTRTMIWYNGTKANQSVPLLDQSIEVLMSMRGLPLFYFSPENHEYKTRVGKRWGVVVTIAGSKIHTGGFHMRKGRQGSPKGKGAFFRDSQVIRRIEGTKDDYRPFSFKSVALILEPRREYLENYGVEYFHKQINRNMTRYGRELNIENLEMKKM